MLSDKDIYTTAKPFICPKAEAIPDDGAIENFARAIEAEAHKQYADLIRQTLGALEDSSPCVTAAHEWKSLEWIAKRANAITTARARLGENR